MVGNIVIVYDSSIEDVKNLDKFKVILLKAKFNEALLSFINKEDFLTTLESADSSTLPSFVICINQTYKEVSLKYSNILDIPNFEFSSKTYIDSSKKLLLYGLPLNIETIFDTNKYKNFVWSLVNAFLKNYLEFTDNSSDSIIIKKEKDIEEKIFLPFFTTRITGAGIGLTLSKAIIEAHRGHLVFYREDNGNTTFDVILPITT